MFEWIGARYARLILVACLLLAVVFLATGLVLRFVTVVGTEVDTTAVSETVQFFEAGPGPPVDALGAPDPGRAHQVTTVEAQSGSSPASADVDIPRRAWSPTARLSIHSSKPNDLTVTQPAPSPNTGDGSHADTAATDTSPHRRTDSDVVIVSPTSHSGVDGTGSGADAADPADGTIAQDERSLQHVVSGAGGSFAARLHRRVTGIADAPAIGIAVGGIGGPALDAHHRHQGPGGGDVWSGISRAQTDFGPSLARFAADPSEGLSWRKFQSPSPNGKRLWSETKPDNSPGTAALGSLVPQAANDATGVPTISGVAQVGHELTASTTGISDTDGNTKAEAGDMGYAYTYQWVRVDGSDETDISGATSKTYTLAADDAGKTLKVKVSFVDDADNDEGPLTSAETATVVVPVVTIVADSSSALYRYDNVSFTLTRTESTAIELTARVKLSQEQRFLEPSRRFPTVTFAAGSATATLTISKWDFLFPIGKVMRGGTLTASMVDPKRYDVGTPASATVNMIIPLTLTLALSSSSVSEESEDKAVATLIARSGEGAPVPNLSINVAILTEADTAESGVDYVPFSRIFAIRSDDFMADGSVYKAERAIEVPIVNDNVPDSDETFNFVLQPTLGMVAEYWHNIVDSDGKRCGSSCRFKVTITDDDPDGTYIETLEITSSPADTVSYLVGETVTVEATYMDAVTVSSSGTAPFLALTIGDKTRAAAYTGTSADGKTLTFSYTIVSQDHDQDGISVAAGQIALNGGTIVKRGTSDAANPRVPPLRADSGQRVNKDAEIVSDGVVVTSTPAAATNTYGAGETIVFTVTFDLPVTVSGTPRLLFELGDSGSERNEYLTYVRGSGTGSLVFEYVVQSADTDEDGIFVNEDALQTNGGAIRRSATGRDAILNHPHPGSSGSFPGHKVNGSLMPTIAELTGLSLSGATLSPEFAPDTTRYTAMAAYAVASTTVTATAETGTDVTILPVDSHRTADGHQVDLEEGHNEITVTASQAGSAPRTYTVAVTRAPSKATGVPEIYGRVQVDQLLLVSTFRISDPAGKTNAEAGIPGYAYTYQWVRVDGANESDIAGATRNIYWPKAADEGKTLKVRVSFVDDAGNPEGPLTSAATAAVAAAANATGAPTISGVAQVGQVLTASTAGISDPDGKIRAESGDTGYAFTYQWSRADGGSRRNIPGATSKTYRLAAADEGKTLKVRVSFVDDAGNPEGPLNSEATAVVLAAAGNATGAPTISGVAQVGQVLTASTAGISDPDGKIRAESGDTGYAFTYQWLRVVGANESDIAGETSKTYRAAAADEGKTLKVKVAFVDDADNPEGPLISAATAVVTRPMQPAHAATAATGAPTISGVAQVGQVLTASTAGISDPDGKIRAESGDTGYAYTYQWLRVDGVNESAISGATEATYTLVAKDEGNSLKVRVSFVDDAGNPEGPLTSAATATVKAANNPATGAPTISGVAQVGQVLTASTAGISDPDGKIRAESGESHYAYTYQWLRVDSGSESDTAGATEATYTVLAADEGKTLKVRVSFVDDAGNPEGPLTSAATAAVAAAANATGAPTISGVAQVGQVLTASTAGISDPDGKIRAESGESHYAYTYQWLRVDGGSESDTAGATEATYTVLAADEGKTLKVRVSFVDDAGNPEGPLTSAATATVKAANNPATGAPTISGVAQVGQVLTASTAGISDPDGKIRAESGESHYAYTYQWLRVDGGSESDIAGATSETYTALGADEGKTLKVRVSFVDDAGNPEGPLTSAATATVKAANNPATGAPTISGVAQVGQVLTASTAGISDPDGKIRAESGDPGYAYTYRWLRMDGGSESDIAGATSKTYRLAAADEGKTLKVRVSFVDDAGNPEGPLISAATAAVKAANNPATGAPTIAGRAQVGQVLTASTASIADPDGKIRAESGDPGYAYTYRWLRVDGGSESDIAGATSETYTALAADEGKSLKVKVSFVDDADNPEGPLTSAATAVVLRAAPALSVLDAEVEERANAVMAFAVRLDRVASKLVTVRYATADGSAVAGFDYTAASGLLTFALGETQRTVSVPVHDDAHVEGDETLTLTLSDASGAQIADGLATGTILANSDPIPKAWLLRFGRTVAHQILDAVDERLATTPRRGIDVRFAGKRFSVANLRQVEGEEAEPAGRPDRSPNWHRGEDDEGGTLRFESQQVATADLFTGNSISLTKGTREGGFISLWSEGALSYFSGREDELRLGGEVASAMVGAGWTDGARAAGLVISHSRGEGTYRTTRRSHDIESRLTGVFPYGRYPVNERLSLWGVAGYGRGTQAFAPEGTETVESDFDMKMAAAGIRGELLTPAENDGLEIALKSDAMVVNTATEALPGAPSGVGGYVTRFALGLEARGHSRDKDDGLSEPVFEVGGRYDGGDAETGFGIDFGGGLSWTDRNLGLEAEVRARALVSLDDKDFRERGVAGSLSWDPDPQSEIGPSLSLSQTVGASATGGAGALLARDTLAGLADDEGESLGRQFEAKLGYGHPVPGGRFTGTTELGLRLADKSREYALGWRLLPAHREQDALELLLEGTRRESTEEEREPEHQVRMDLINRW